MYKLARRAAYLAAITLMHPATAGDTLRDAFTTPPDSAKPRVWWHWMNGNVTQEGIRADLEWMKRVGVGGLQHFDANLQTPQVVADRRVFMSGPWRADFRFAAQEAERLGLELAIASSGGWSLSGGPWVKPQQAMKKLVWSTAVIAGGRHLTTRLPAPPAVAGPFQDIPAEGKDATTFYRDVIVLAYPAAAAAAGDERAAVSASMGALDGGLLTDEKLADSVQVPIPSAERPSWLRFDYATPHTFRAVTVTNPAARGFGGAPTPEIVLQASDDGRDFADVAAITFGHGLQLTVSFEARRARTWRLWFRAPRAGGPPPFAPGVVLPAFGPPATSYAISEVRLHELARIHRFEDKAGFAAAADYNTLPTPETPSAMAVKPADVIDLTGLMKQDGTLDWMAPPGQWTVLRIGYGLTGHRNGPASPEATGLEVDKLSAVHVNSYLDHYLGLYTDTVGKDLIGKHGIRALLNDSIESGAQNWTEDMATAFRQRRGYGLERWLPAVTGQIVESAQASDRFLWDFRRTIAELLAERHYGTMASRAKALGLTLYGEALEDQRPQLGDDLEMRKHASIPMAAMWTVPQGAKAKPTYAADIRGAASVAHIWGQNLVAAESMTAFGQPWAFSPRDLKATADLEFALGVNRIVIHTSTHQPLDRKPGLALAPFLGQYFNRNETWAELSAPWLSYLARTSMMLQQGRFAADVAYFYGEEGPVTGLYGDKENTDVPQGYAFDYVNQDALLHQLSVKGGQLVTPSGMRYRLLYLGGASRRMTLPTLRRLDVLVHAGATVVGEAPVDSPSLADSPAEFSKVVNRLWGASAQHGKGRVLSGRTLSQALQVLAIDADVAFSGTPDRDGLSYVHRIKGADDIYFISNGSERAQRVDASFRVAGKQPEFWQADDGSARPASYSIAAGRTSVPLELAPHESVFVVFSGRAKSAQRTVSAQSEQVLTTLAGPWQLTFEAGRGGPATPIETPLGSWTQSPEPGMRFFSGTGSYKRKFDVDARAAARGQVLLDLGDVRDIAQVLVNGRDLGIAWKPPYRFDIGAALRPGANELEVRVTNPWVNRLIGDAQAGAVPVAFTTGGTYAADAPLRSSGLVGPVRLLIKEKSTP
jgi:hypothetical protein